MAYFTLQLDERAIEEILHDPAGPVGVELGKIAQGMTSVAEGAVPYMQPENYAWSLRRGRKGAGPGPTQYMPRVGGWTAAGIFYHGPDLDAAGHLFAGTNAPYAPTLWLEHGRNGRRMTRHRFMTQALDSASV